MKRRRFYMDRYKKIVLGIMFFLILGGICSMIWKGITSQPFQIDDFQEFSCPWTEGRELQQRFERQEMEKRAEESVQKEKMQREAAKKEILVVGGKECLKYVPKTEFINRKKRSRTQYQEQGSNNSLLPEQDGGVMKKIKKKE